jgi:hypothetical protein
VHVGKPSVPDGLPTAAALSTGSIPTTTQPG